MKYTIVPASLLAAFCLLPSGNADDPKVTKDNVPPDGYVALFNGKDLKNWQGLVDMPTRAKLTPEQLAETQKKANDDILPHWMVSDDGVLVYDGKANNLDGL